jgi:hypothetical protein
MPRGFDLRFMSQAYASSAHIPLSAGGKRGTLNFWSTEPDAFPPALVAVLQELAAHIEERRPE